MRLLATAVEVPIERLFLQPKEPDESEREFIVRPPSRRVLSLDHRGMLLEMICPMGEGELQTFIANIAPGGGSGPEMDTHQGEEVGLVLAGEFELWLGNRHYLLREGDSFRYPASIPHRYANPGQTMTRVHFTITPPFYSYKLWAAEEA
jgi:quercetin dioxygenase-like cupin family protein